MPNKIQHCKRGGEGWEGKVKLANLPNTSVHGCSSDHAFDLTFTLSKHIPKPEDPNTERERRLFHFNRNNVN